MLAIVCILSSFYVFVALGQTNETDSAVGFEIVVNYADGTHSEPYKQSMFSLLEMYSLVDMSGKEIESFDIRLKAILSTSGVVTGWQVIGSQQTEIYKGSESVPKTSATYAFDKSGSTWAEGTEKELTFVTLHWSQVGSSLEQFGTGEWNIQINGAISVTVEFDDESDDVADATASVSMPFNYYDSGIDAFSLVINNGVNLMSLSGQLESIGIPMWTLLVALPVFAVVFASLAIWTYKTEE